MPKVKALAEKPQEAELLEIIGGAMASMRVTKEGLAKRSGIPPSTISFRMKHVGTFRVDDLWAINDAMKKAGLRKKIKIIFEE